MSIELPISSGDRSWMDLAACAEVGGDICFPDKGESVQPAKLVCAGCDVRAECLRYSIGHDLRYGVWGGLSERERRNLHRNHNKPADQTSECSCASSCNQCVLGSPGEAA